MLNSSSQAPLCSIHRLSRSAGRLCSRDVQLLVKSVGLSGECETRTCPHGLIHTACPLIIEGQIIAVLLVGQVLFTDPDKEALAELRRCAGIQFDPDLTVAFIEQVRENGLFNLDG